MLEKDLSAHVENVVNKVAGSLKRGHASSSDIEAMILGSWRRCLVEYNLDPSRRNAPRILTDRALRRHVEPLEEFMSTARFGMMNLRKQIARAGYVIFLGDAHGVIIDFLCNSGEERESREAGLCRGVLWSESVEGTCGVGTCIEERRTITIHRDEHFRACHIWLSSTCTPLFSSDDTLLGTIGISHLRSPPARESQILATQMLSCHARMIENAYFLSRYKDSWVIRFNSEQAYLEVSVENIVAVNHDGFIVAANRSALKECAEAVNKHISEVFAIGFDNLMEHAVHKTAMILPVRFVQSGKEYFATFRAPEFAIATPAGKRNETVSRSKVDAPSVMSLESLAGTDPVMIQNAACAKRVMNKDIVILITGETGTGKEVFARAVHEASERSDKPFVALNCASIPESLIESELFGYKEGAFTGARGKGMRGHILKSDGGTLFLDEIGDMPLNLQARLLRVLAEKEVLPLGSERPVPVDLHVVCATLRNLEALVRQGKFREDLYYRLNGVTISLPPLRDRKDKRLLIQSIVEMESGNRVYSLRAEAFEIFLNYNWPGNVRQLRNVLRYVLAMSESGVVGIAGLPRDLLSSSSLQEKIHETAVEKTVVAPPDSIKHAERSAIMYCLTKRRWNVTSASQDLRISRATLYRKMKKYAINPPKMLSCNS